MTDDGCKAPEPAVVHGGAGSGHPAGQAVSADVVDKLEDLHTVDVDTSAHVGRLVAEYDAAVVVA